MIDAASLPSGTALEADVCVVGAGPAGLTLGHELAGSGLRVIVLERGGRRVDRANAQVNALEIAGHPIGRPHRVRRFAVGGAGWLWSRFSLELDALTFESRPWLAHSGWPLTAGDMSQFYRRARLRLGVPPAGSARDNDTERNAWPAELTRRPVDRSPVRFGAPETTRDIPVYFDARLTGLTTGPHGAIVNAETATTDGPGPSVKAAAYVLAAGGIENPRLLLLSDVGNGFDQVGRYFADHPYLTLTTSLPTGSRPPGGVAWARGEAARAIVTLPEQVLREEELLGSAAFFRSYRNPEVWDKPGVAAWQDIAWALRNRDAAPQRRGLLTRAAIGFPQMARALRDRSSTDGFGLRVVLEPAPNPESRITLSERRDANGVPLPRIDWRLTGAEHRTLSRLLAALVEAAEDADWGPMGLPDGDGWPDRLEGGAHHMGTTRMHRDARQGVVDPDCRVHGTPNLFVAGSSVFPTFGYANPTLTIVALAIRLADHLKATLK